MFCIGLTGTIASGKTTVAQAFARLGIEVIYADDIARVLTRPGTYALQKIIQRFGDELLQEEGALNRRALRDIIFRHPDERQWLENLLHPLIRKEIEKAVGYCKSPYCIIEIPLLFDKKSYPYLNRILLVSAEPEVQIVRLMKRDSIPRKAALAILNVQPDGETRRALADDILINSGTLEDLNINVSQLNRQYLQDAALTS